MVTMATRRSHKLLMRKSCPRHSTLRRYIFQKLLLAQNFSCINKNCFFIKETDIWPHCCMNNLYISPRSLYAPTYSFKAISSMFISLFRFSFRFNIVGNNVTRWVNSEKTVCMNMNYDYLATIYRSILAQIYVFLVLFTILHFGLEKIIGKNCKCIFFYQKFGHLDKNTSIYCSWIIVVHVHANGFL